MILHTGWDVGWMTRNEFSVIKGRIISHFIVPEKSETLVQDFLKVIV